MGTLLSTNGVTEISYEVIYTPYLIRILIDLMDTIENVSLSEMNVTYFEHCILSMTEIFDGPFELRELDESIPVKTNTIVAAVLRLERKGYIRKSTCASDKRTISIELYDGTLDKLSATSHLIFNRLKKSLWSKFSIADFQSMKSCRPNICSNLGIDIRACTHTSTSSLTPSYFLMIYLLLKSINGTLRSYSDLSLTDYRLLLCLRDKARKPNIQDISQKLAISPSCVSSSLKRLRETGFVDATSSNDCREKPQFLTERGAVVLALCNQKLATLVAEAYEGTSPSDMAVINELHIRMYSYYL